MNRRVWQALATALASMVCVASCSGHGSETEDGGFPQDSSKSKSGLHDAGPDAPACGAATGTLCSMGEPCKSGADCSSNTCQAEMCVPSSCTDGMEDGTETDVDCGGGQCAGCPAGDTCKLPRDCQSDVCANGLCKAPTDTDGVKNDSETDVDCGGALLANGQKNSASDGASACQPGKACLIPEDCTTDVCASGPVVVDNLDGGAGGDATVKGGGTLTCQTATDQDGVKNDSETDVDCGGGFLASGAANTMSDGAPPCGANKACVLATDCQSLVCTSGVCQAPNATDMVKNDSETDVDCGGGFLASGAPNPASDGAPPCPDDKSCILGTDCVDLVCAGAPVGTMGSADGGPIDCSSGTACTCQPPTPTDGVKNDSETDIDCGGGFLAGGDPNTASDGAPVCQLGQSCLLGTDCFAGVCNSNMEAGGPPVDCPMGDTCQCQSPSPTDGVKNDSETDVDCGGGTSLGSDGAPACAPGKKCNVGADCTSFICGTNGLCTTPSPTDGVQNDSETDVDCGGGASATTDGAHPCTDAKKCLVGTDCLSAFCSTISNTCVDGQSCVGLITPAPIQDVDVLASTTVNGADAVGVPDPNGAGQNAGLDTCGAGESTDAIGDQTHESCCKSLLVSGTGTRLDKYEVTAGRIRQWIETVNAWSTANGDGAYNVQAWVKAQLAAPVTAVGALIAEQMPTTGTSSVVPLFPASAIGSDPINIVQQLGGTTVDKEYPSYAQGCNMGPGLFGASTYWWDSNGEAQVGSPPRPFTQDYYDVKSINCAPYWMGAAFCAWDGGRLANDAEYTALWPSTYPWPAGTLPVLADGADVSTPGLLDTQASNAGYAITAYTVEYYNGNLGNPGGGEFYFYPSYRSSVPSWAGSVDTLTPGTDLTPYIAAPGRFFLDATAVHPTGSTDTWQDVGANMMELKEVVSPWTSDGVPWCDTSGTDANGDPACSGGYERSSTSFTVNWTGGSWEGHPIARENYDEPAFTQYGKAGFRCARAAEPAP